MPFLSDFVNIHLIWKKCLNKISLFFLSLISFCLFIWAVKYRWFLSKNPMEGRNERREDSLIPKSQMRSVLAAENTQYHTGSLKRTWMLTLPMPPSPNSSLPQRSSRKKWNNCRWGRQGVQEGSNLMNSLEGDEVRRTCSYLLRNRRFVVSKLRQSAWALLCFCWCGMRSCLVDFGLPQIFGAWVSLSCRSWYQSAGMSGSRLVNCKTHFSLKRKFSFVFHITLCQQIQVVKKIRESRKQACHYYNSLEASN